MFIVDLGDASLAACKKRGLGELVEGGSKELSRTACREEADNFGCTGVDEMVS